MEHKSLLLCSHEPAVIGHHHVPKESSSHPHMLYV